jgi:hypothetical protein
MTTLRNDPTIAPSTKAVTARKSSSPIICISADNTPLFLLIKPSLCTVWQKRFLASTLDFTNYGECVD